MNVYLESLGCRVNQSEIEELARQFAGIGHRAVADPADADAVILNTCAVTEAAERKSRRRAASIAHQSPNARVAVIGCYASLAPDRGAPLPGVAWVVPNARKHDTLALVASTPPLRSQCPGGSLAYAAGALPRTRAFLKVQDGCDNRCTYCITRLLPGPARSLPLPVAVGRAQELADSGSKEIVLTGVNLGSYGRDLGLRGGLRGLIEALLRHSDVPRLRLSSLEPWGLDEDFFELWSNRRLCRQLHVPLQAGHDETLRRMGRPISVDRFAWLVETARKAVPYLAVTTDLIAGFPGEDESAFRASYDRVASVAFARTHISAHSARPGTPANRYREEVPLATGARRARRLRALGSKQATAFRQQFFGITMTVLWERRRPDGSWRGLTDNYLRVTTQDPANLHNTHVPTKLVRPEDGHLVGQVVTSGSPSRGLSRDLR